MKAKALAIAGLCALAVALALPAGGVAATPTVTRVKGSEHNPSFNICGLDLTTDFTFTAVEVVTTSGVSLNAGEFTAVWTNPATGKSIVIHAGQMGMTSAPIDNGDGTISFIGSGNGTYIVKAANGGPITLQAGRFTARVTLTATGDLVSVELISVDGPHSPPADSDCTGIVGSSPGSMHLERVV